jgi:hypothetical protein
MVLFKQPGHLDRVAIIAHLFDNVKYDYFCLFGAVAKKERSRLQNEHESGQYRPAPPILKEIEMRSRAFRRHQAHSHMWRRLKEDRNQHYNDLTCACWTDLKAMARFKEQPQTCSNPTCCGNPRRDKGNISTSRTMQERRHDIGLRSRFRFLPDYP